MATYRKSILANVNLGTTGAYPDLYDTMATNDLFKQQVICFPNPTADIKIYGSAAVPQNFFGTAKLVVIWTSTVITGNFGIEFSYRAIGGNDSESLDQSSFQETVNTTDVAPGATDRRMEITLDLTSANLAANDTLEWMFARDDSADTLAGIVQLHALELQYADV